MAEVIGGDDAFVVGHEHVEGFIVFHLFLHTDFLSVFTFFIVLEPSFSLFLILRRIRRLTLSTLPITAKPISRTIVTAGSNRALLVLHVAFYKT